MTLRPSDQLTPTPSADRILRAAASLFSARGYAATSTRDIAAAVGIKQPTLYKHFSSKDDILFALVRLAIQPLAVLAGTLLEVAAPADLRVCRWVRDAAVHLTGSPHSIGSLLTVPTDSVSPRLRAEFDRYEDLERDLALLIAAGQAEGTLAAGDPTDLARLALVSYDTFALPETSVSVDSLVGFVMAALLTDRTRLPDLVAAQDDVLRR